MGVTIQEYRIRVGTFNQLTNPRKSRSRSLSSNSGSRSPILAMVSYTLTCSLLVLFIKLTQPTLTNLYPVLTCNPPGGPSSCTPGLKATISEIQTNPKNAGFGPRRIYQAPWPPTSSCPVSKSTSSVKSISTVSPPGPFLITHSPRSFSRCTLCASLLAPSSWLTAVEKNAVVRATYGNRGQQGRGIKCVVWNKGSSHLENKQCEIESIIGFHHPHILGLCEANLKSNVDLSLVSHQEYNLHVAKSLSHPELGVARTVVYTHSYPYSQKERGS